MLLSTRDFVTRLTESGLSTTLPPDIATELLALPTAEAAASSLVERNLLTDFQATVLISGDKIPLIIGDYVVVGSLGRGGMGYVLKARHRRMKRDVAIKFLLKELTASTDMRRRFEREVEAAAQLNHQNIVTAYDAGEYSDGSCYLVMQFVDGDDLSHLVKANGPLKIPQAIDIICQAAEGLAFAHEKGIVHRDIKPGNLLLDKDGVVRILDMGLARMRPTPGDALDGGEHADLTNTGSVMGTIDYMAPEQALDAKSADHRADIYSLGCTLWFLLSGNPPYRSDTVMRRLLAHREQEIPRVSSLWPDAPSELDDILRSMMAKSKEDRFPSMRHLIVALRGLEQADLELSQMATMDVAEESEFAATRPRNERFAAPSSRTAPLPLSDDQINGAKPALTTVRAEPTMIQDGRASDQSETVTFKNNDSHLEQRLSKNAGQHADSANSAVEPAAPKSPAPSKVVVIAAGVCAVVIVLFAAFWSSKKPATSSDDSRETVQSDQKADVENDAPAVADVEPKAEPQTVDLTEIDLLQMIDPKRDGIGNSWRMANGSLQTFADTEEGDRRLNLPIQNPPDEYDIHLTAERGVGRENALVLGLVTGGRRVGLVMGWRQVGGSAKEGLRSRGGLWGLEEIDGKRSIANSTAVSHEPLKQGESAEVLVQVRQSGIRVERDGKLLINWNGSPNQLSLNERWDDKGPPRFFVGAQGDFTIHRLTFKPIPPATAK